MAEDAAVPERLIRACVELMRRRGVDGFGVSELLAESGVARQSMYHHFPGGKAELVTAATADAAGYLMHVLDRGAAAEPDPAAVIAAWTAWWKKMLVESDYGVGCPLAAASLVAERYPGAADRARSAFEDFGARARASFRGAGIEDERAEGLASVAVSAIEGAIIQARSLRSVQPLDRVAEHFRTLLEGAVRAPSD